MRSRRTTIARSLRSTPTRAGVVAGCLLLALAACRPKPEPQLRIGLLGVASSAMSATSGLEAAQRGARLALDELNKGGGVLIGGVRHRVVLIERIADDRPDAAAQGARALINLDLVDVIIGPQLSAHATAAGAVAEASGVPLIAPMATNPAVTAGRRFVFRLSFLDEFQGVLLARFAYDSLRARRAAALYDPASLYSRDIVRIFGQTFGERGGTVVGAELFSREDGLDYRTQLRRIIAGRPDVILLPGFAHPDSIQMRQARALGFRGHFLGPDSWDPVELGPLDAAKGSAIVGNWHWRSARPESRQFIAAFEALHHAPPRTNAAATYDAMKLVALVAARAGSLDGTALARALSNAGTYAGVTATFVFHGTQNPVRGGIITRLLDGSDSTRWIEVSP